MTALERKRDRKVRVYVALQIMKRYTVLVNHGQLYLRILKLKNLT